MINNLYTHIDNHNIDYIECEIPTDKMKGMYFDNTIVIDSRIQTEVERKCILAEEIGHFETSYGIILDADDIKSLKQEVRARRWAYIELLPIERFIDCYEQRCRSRFEVSEFLEVTETFLDEAIKSYQEIYGDHIKKDNYIIYFNPFGVMKMF